MLIACDEAKTDFSGQYTDHLHCADRAIEEIETVGNPNDSCTLLC